jgi:hypothetical protein
MMPVLLIILIPLGALVIYAVVFDLRQRRHGGVPGSHDISSAARMARADADARASISGAGADIGGGAGLGAGVGLGAGGGGGLVG